MRRFRIRPAVVEAIRYDGENGATIVTWMELWERERRGFDLGYALRITTPEGPVQVDPGDWIVTGADGRFFPCKPDVFAATYEPA